MKKAHWLVAAAMLAMGAALFGQSINVTSPGAGNDWCLGSTHAIIWTSSGVSGNVIIVLRPADQPMSEAVLTIAASTANDGSFSWAIPGSGLAAGTYEVRVRTVTTDPFVFGDSANLTISSCPAPSASINVTSPVAGNDWCLGSTHAITWTSSGVSGNVMIVLRPADSPMADPVLTIAASTANDGSYSWAIPGSGLAAGTYEVRVRTVTTDPFMYGDSANFEVKDCAAPGAIVAPVSPPTYRVMPSLAVTFPDARAKLYKGTDCTLRWRSTAVAGPVAITLRRNDAPEAERWQSIAASTENDGEHLWRVPHSLEPGVYRVRVATVSASPPLAAKSPPFSVYPAVGIATVIPTRIETLTLPVNFRTSMRTWEEHSSTAEPIPNRGIEVPANEFLAGYRTGLRIAPFGFAYRCQIFRGSPNWDVSRLRPLVGKTLTYARLSFRHKKTESTFPAIRTCVSKAIFFAGRLGEANPAPYRTLVMLDIAEGGTHNIDVLEMMSNWLREEEPGYAGQQHHYRLEIAGTIETRGAAPRQNAYCLSWFDNGVVTINYTD